MGERQRAKARGKKKFMLEMIFQLGLKGRRGGGERESGERERKYGRTGIMVLAGESREGKGERVEGGRGRPGACQGQS